MEKVAFFGGSFDPPHQGHVDIVRYVLENTSVEKALVVPVFEAPHKSKHRPTSFEHRLAMIRAAIGSLGGRPGIEVSDVESRLESPSYTWRTLSYLQEQNPGWQIHLVIGEDMYESFESWYHYREILQHFSLIVLARSQEHKYQDHSQERKEERLYFPDNPLWQMSSTQLRRMFREWHATGDEALFQRLQKLVPEPVLQYIEKNNLYR